jgi:hypothetical protein
MTKVIDRDLGYDALLGQLGDLGHPRVLVGIQQDDGSEMSDDGEITLAGYAAVNEFGSNDGHVPERSFLRSTVDERQAEYQGELDKAAGHMIDETIRGGVTAGQRALENDLKGLGEDAVGHVKKKIRDLRAPPNAPSTLAKKYPGNNPLIETGRMRQNISKKVEMG